MTMMFDPWIYQTTSSRIPEPFMEDWWIEADETTGEIEPDKSLYLLDLKTGTIWYVIASYNSCGEMELMNDDGDRIRVEETHIEPWIWSVQQ